MNKPLLKKYLKKIILVCLCVVLVGILVLASKYSARETQYEDAYRLSLDTCYKNAGYTVVPTSDPLYADIMAQIPEKVLAECEQKADKDTGTTWVRELEKDSQNRTTVQTRNDDPDCTQNLENYADRYTDPMLSNESIAVEHVYYGNLKKNTPLQLVLSCDQERITITGSVTQVIDSKNKLDYPYQGDADFVDLSQGEAVIDVNTDYNFDGYNDITVVRNVAGSSLSSNIFLYDQKNQKFVYNDELSHIENSAVDVSSKTVQGTTYDEHQKGTTLQYVWKDGHVVPQKNVSAK